ncbi:MAG: hypothetical protein LGL72_00380, partial [Acidibrevibacterium sp.]|nr:hypothetical protein [Acidibrevibacterium fodinaquatile]
MIAPAIAGTYPARRSPSEQLAYNRIPDIVPPGRRGSQMLFAAKNAPPPSTRSAPPVQVASRSLIAPVTAEPLPPLPAPAPAPASHSSLALAAY